VATWAPLVKGTAITWSSSGGTYVIDFSAGGAGVATGAGRKGAKSTSTLIDGTKGFPAVLEVYVKSKFQAAPSLGKTVDLYFAWSPDGTVFPSPGLITGSDGALTSSQLADLTGGQVTFIGSLNCTDSNDGNSGTGQQISDFFVIAPKDEFIVPVLSNQSGQTTTTTGTDHVITVTPWYQQSS
jgi:hypothetical protein